MHAAHFWIRDAASAGLRPVQKYLERLDDIRRLQDFIVERARDAGRPGDREHQRRRHDQCCDRTGLEQAGELERV